MWRLMGVCRASHGLIRCDVNITEQKSTYVFSSFFYWSFFFLSSNFGRYGEAREDSCVGEGDVMYGKTHNQTLTLQFCK